MRRDVQCVIIGNPISGGGKTLAMINSVVIPHLTAAGITSSLTLSTYPRHITDLLRDFVRGDRGTVRVICVAGGDGTMQEAVSALFPPVVDGCKPPPPPADFPPIVPVPCGTGNGVARSLGIVSVLAAARVAAAVAGGSARHVTRLNVMRALLPGAAPGGGALDVASCLSMSVGTSARHDVMTEITLRRWWIPRAVAVMVANILLIILARVYPVAVRLRPSSGVSPGPEWSDDGGGWYRMEGGFKLSLTANTPWLASDVCIAPRVGCAEPAVEVCLVRAVSVMRMLLLMVGMSSRDFALRNDGNYLTRVRATAVRMEGVGGVPLPVSIDGVPFTSAVAAEQEVCGSARVGCDPDSPLFAP